MKKLPLDRPEFVPGTKVKFGHGAEELVVEERLVHTVRLSNGIWAPVTSLAISQPKIPAEEVL